MKIGIFGGTFDPIHLGHLQMARLAYHIFLLDRMFFIPSGDSYMKTNVTNAYDRFQMVKLALEDEDNFDVDDMEIMRKGPSYSYRTIEEYSKRYPNDEICFLLGEDSLRNIHLWKNAEIIFSKATILAAGRKEHSDLDSFYHDSVNIQDVIQQLENDYQAKIQYFQYDNPVSSSVIRQSIREKNSVNRWLPDKVADYITDKSLYLSKFQDSGELL